MTHAMTKEEFLSIHERQLQSGLSIKDFCENESYPAASFYYWQSKFGLRRSSKVSSFPMDQLAPIRFPANSPGPVSHSGKPSVESDISIEFPGGIKVHFAGSSASDTALCFFIKLLNSHVLPE